MRFLTALLAACLSVASFAFDVPCLDPLACNFLEEGECFFTDENGDLCVIEGCTIEGACNYDPEADIYDGSCEFVSCLGCTDSEACNYDSTALYDDATCIYYVDCNGTCGGDWIEDACGNCYSPETTITTEFTLTNCGNSGRIGPSQDMCDAQYGVNVVIVEDGMQHWTVPITGFYQFTASGAQGGSLTDWGMGATVSAEFFLSAGEILKIGIGQMGELACVGGGEAAGGGGGSTGVSNMQTGELLLLAAGGGGQGRSQFEADQWSTGSSELFGQSTYSDIGQLVANGGIDGMGGESGSNPHNDWPQAGGGAGVLSDGADGDGGGGGIAYGGRANGLGGGYTNSNDCRAEGGFGYTGGGASEHGGGGGGGYSGGGGGASAGASDLVYINGGGGGSFVDSSGQAVSITAGANAGHGLIIITWEVETSPICNPGCTYPQACNYNLESNFDDGSCDYCFCGEGTQWVDSLQACMVTEAALMQSCGEGTYWDDALSACVPSACFGDFNDDGMRGTEDLLQFLIVFDTTCPSTVSAFTCGDLVGFDGYDYQTVQIGSQCWFAENLRTTTYANGDPIPGNLTDSEWTSTTSGATTIYGEGSSTVYDGSDDEVANLEAYGRLYNWYAVDDSRSLCPSGWHVPADGEWTDLTDYLGGSLVAGTEMKSSPADSPSWNGTNTSGFSALPGGWRGVNNSSFYLEGDGGYFWSASPAGASDAWFRVLVSDFVNVNRINLGQRYGFSVRCVRDE